MNKKIFRVSTRVCGFKLFDFEFHLFCPHRGRWCNNRQVAHYEYSRAFDFRKEISFLEALVIPAGREDYIVQKMAMYPKKPITRMGRIAHLYKRDDAFRPNGTFLGSGRTDFTI